MTAAQQALLAALATALLLWLAVLLMVVAL